MGFTDAEKTDIRRFCGYAAYGAVNVSMQSWRFYQAYGLLEFRMNNLSESEMVVVRRYLGTLVSLENAIPLSGENLDTDQAAIWTRNRKEFRDRMQLFDGWRRRLCGFFGVPVGASARDVSVTLVV